MDFLVRRPSSSLPSLLLRAALALAGFAPWASAQLVPAPGKVPLGAPGNASYSENVDFGDVDADGDWDAVFADGGDQGSDQNRLWMNQGGAQGGSLGSFADETAVRLPLILDPSRDVELGDIDCDGDPDLFVANSAMFSADSSRIQVNQGAGFFADETATRWVGIGGPGSSVSPGLVHPGGGFLDWAGDGDFADLDADGDLDLVQASYGPEMSGSAPTRLFLNDGSGFFAEHNPSGFQLTGAAIQNGDPALWAEGVHLDDTTDTSGLSADIAQVALDVELGDIDGDFDLDLLLGARDTQPRLFANRLEESGGALTFRDRSHDLFPPGWAPGSASYEQELADLDADGDLDLLGVNWSGFHDVSMRNDGSGVFGAAVLLPSSGADDHEIDALDYDNDGDLDVFVANFSGTDRLYRSQPDPGLGFQLVLAQSVSGSSSTSLDADACDVDGDGDYDVMTAASFAAANVLLENVTQVPDTHAPRIPNVEGVADRSASTVPQTVRAHVYDNAPYYVTAYDTVSLDVSVDGKGLGSFPMKSSGGQVFRGELPGNLVGNVSYVVRASDEYGNTGFASQESYFGSGVGGTPYGAGSSGAAGIPDLAAQSVAFPGTTLYLAGDSVAAGASCLLFVSASPQCPPLVFPGVAVTNLGLDPTLTLLATGTADPAGCVGFELPVDPATPLGARVYAQLLAVDSSAGFLFASSPGLALQVGGGAFDACGTVETCDVDVSGPDRVCAGQSVTFAATDEDPAGGTYSWSVDGGAASIDGASDQNTAKVKAGAAAGSVTVKLTYTAPEGASCVAEKDLAIVKVGLTGPAKIKKGQTTNVLVEVDPSAPVTLKLTKSGGSAGAATFGDGSTQTTISKTGHVFVEGVELSDPEGTANIALTAEVDGVVCASTAFEVVDGAGAFDGVTFTLATETGASVPNAAKAGFVMVGNVPLLLLEGEKPAKYTPEVTIAAPSGEKAQEYEVGLIQNLLSTTREATYSSGTVVKVFAEPVPIKDGAPPSTTVFDAVFAQKGPALLEGFSGDGDDVQLELPDVPSTSATVFEKDEAACGGVGAGKLQKLTVKDSFRTWVAVRHKPSGCVMTLHHIDWETDWEATVACGQGGSVTSTLVKGGIAVTETDGDGSPPFIQGAPVANDAVVTECEKP